MEHDLTSTISEYLDRHLVIPLLEFIDQHPNMDGVYAKSDIMQAKLELLSNTNMVDYAIEIHHELHDSEPPVELVERRDKVLMALQALQEDAGHLIDIMANEELMAELTEGGNFNLDYLSREHDITEDVLEAVYEFGKFQFDCGNYEDAASLMEVYRTLMNGKNI